MVLKTYRIGDLAADEQQAEAVVRVIKTLVEPESWPSFGPQGTGARWQTPVHPGSGAIEYFAAKHVLLVRQTPEVHQQVDALLRLLMESGDAPAKPTRGTPGGKP